MAREYVSISQLPSLDVFGSLRANLFSLTSRLLDPIKALGKTGLFSNVFNKFDGGVEVLDDLDDHWTAKNHKDERKIIIEDLQDLAADRSVRITILGYASEPRRRFALWH